MEGGHSRRLHGLSNGLCPLRVGTGYSRCLSNIRFNSDCPKLQCEAAQLWAAVAKKADSIDPSQPKVVFTLGEAYLGLGR